MRWSDERILTTHTGSLPRPPELTRLYVRRARGEAIDPAELDRVGKAALRRIVDKQIEAGVDIGNNGEQQREAFFLYVRHSDERFRRQLAALAARRCRTLSALEATDWRRCSLPARLWAITSHPRQLAKCVTSTTQN